MTTNLHAWSKTSSHKYAIIADYTPENACSAERDAVLHLPYLEMSDRDQMSSTFT